MAEISIQAVINAITLALRTAYPETIILDDDAGQGIVPDAFIVKIVSAKQQNLTGLRYHRMPVFDVTYFSDNSNPECVSVADTLYMALRTITTTGGDLLHGTGMDWHTEDYTLHFIVSYKHNVRLEREQDYMENLKVQEGGLYG